MSQPTPPALLEAPVLAHVVRGGVVESVHRASVVVTGPGESLTLEEVRAFASERLARYKVPQRLYVLDELPRNATGKVLKGQLREDLASSGE